MSKTVFARILYRKKNTVSTIGDLHTIYLKRCKNIK